MRLIDNKNMDEAQPIWLSGCLTKDNFRSVLPWRSITESFVKSNSLHIHKVAKSYFTNSPIYQFSIQFFVCFINLKTRLKWWWYSTFMITTISSKNVLVKHLWTPLYHITGLCMHLLGTTTYSKLEGPQEYSC